MLSGTATRVEAGGRQHAQPRLAGPGRPGPVHDHRHAVAVDRGEPRGGAPDPHAHGRALRPGDGRQVARQAHGHGRHQSLADGLDFHPHRDRGRQRPHAPESGRVQRQRLLDRAIHPAHLERLGARGVDSLDFLARTEQAHGARHDRDGPQHVTRARLQPDHGPHRHDPLERRVEVDRDGPGLHVLDVHVDAARQLDVAGPDVHRDLIRGGRVGEHPRQVYRRRGQLEELPAWARDQRANRSAGAHDGPPRGGLHREIHGHQRARRLLARGEEPQKDRQAGGGELERDVGRERGAEPHLRCRARRGGVPPAPDWPASSSRARR